MKLFPAVMAFMSLVGVTANHHSVRADDLAPLCDEFDNASTLGNWQRVYQTEGWNANQLQTFDINTSQAGWMRMVPHASTWYQDYRGELAFKDVSGDFVITTHAHHTNRAGNGVPSSQFSLGGIMLRTPRNITPQTWAPGGENYVFLSLGAANVAGTYQFEVKTTVNSVSTLVTQPANVDEADIQVARLGASLIMLRRVANGSWVVHRRYSRPDFPNQLQAGLTVYTDYPTCSGYTPFDHNSTVIAGGNPDLDARFDFVRYRRPIVPPNLQGADFTDPGQVSDAELLSFLGDNADDAQTPGTLSLETNTLSVNEGDGSATINVVRSGGSSGAVSAAYSTSNGSAQAGSDYTGANGTVNFADGETLKSIVVPIADDAIDEADETFNIALSAPGGGATLGTPGSTVVTIVDNDTGPLPNLTIGDVTLAEGSAGTTSFNFTVSLSAVSAQTVTVQYDTADNTATAPADYPSGTGMLSFTPGEVEKTITIAVTGDMLDESNETFRVNLSNSTNANITDAQGIGNITDDEGIPTISINDISVMETNGGSVQAQFTVTLSNASPAAITVNAQSGAGGSPAAAAGSDYTTLPATIVTFNPGQTSKTVSVTVLGDTLDENDEKFAVNLSGAVNATIADNAGVCTIVDNDAAPAISVSAPNVTEGHAGDTPIMTFTFKLSAASARNISVQYQTANAVTFPATAGSDYTAVPLTTVIFLAGETTKLVNVTVKGDVLDEDNERIKLNLTNPVNTTIGTISEGIIVDDDATPSLSINDLSVNEGQSGTKLMLFTVTLSAASGRTVTVNAATGNGGSPAATVGADYLALASTPITFTPGQTSKQVSVTIYGDTTVEQNEKLAVIISGAVNATIADNSGIGTILNDDAAGTAAPSGGDSADYGL